MGTQEKIAKSSEKLCKHRHNFSLILKILQVFQMNFIICFRHLALLEISFFSNPKSPRSLGNDISRLCTEF